MKYKIIRDCVIQGEPKKVGEVVDVDELIGKTLLAIGRVEPHAEEKMENRSVGLENSSEAPKKRGRPSKKSDDGLESDSDV